MNTIDNILAQLHTLADKDKLSGIAHFGIVTTGRLGITMPDLRRIAKSVGVDHPLALQLWAAAIPEARLLAAMVADPLAITSSQMDLWVADFNAWDVCDTACCSLFDRSPLAWDKVALWAAGEPEYTRRAAYALLAGLAWHDKKAPDEKFIAAFPTILSNVTDPRNFVKKAVNWALRNIGKRNLALNAAAVDLSNRILTIDDRTARWIARDALRELTSEKILARLHKKEELQGYS
ncbi:MAG: DNA alkylation repair protein [Chloroflexi bacterium]|nr:DNA alkylation repair protein [Chloroflexota bacterium]